MLTMPPLLLAADPGGVITVILFIIGIIGWISNQISNQKQESEKKRNPPRKKERDSRVQQELEAFLQEATGERQQWRDRSEPVEVSLDEIEVIPATRRPPQQQQPQRKPQQKQQPRPQQQKPPQRPKQPQQRQQSSSSASSPTASSLHVQQHMAPHLAAETAQHLNRQVTASVQSHLGEFAAGNKNSTTASGQLDTRNRPIAPAALMLGKIRSEYGLQAVVVMSEILSTPACRRSGHLGARET